MMGMGMYGGGYPMMPGQMMGNFQNMMPSQVQTDTQLNIAPKIESNVGVFNSVQEVQQNTVSATESAPVKKAPVHESTPYQSIPVEEDSIPEQKIETPTLETSHPHKSTEDAWKDDGDEEDEDDDDEEYDDASDDEGDAPVEKEVIKQNNTVGEPLEQPKQELTEEEKEQQFYEDKPYNRGRGRGGYRGYPRGSNNRGRGRGIRGNRGTFRGSRRGGQQYRQDRGGRGRGDYHHSYQNNEHYYEDQKFEAHQEPEAKVDEDGFAIISKKSYPKKKRRTNPVGVRGRPKATN